MDFDMKITKLNTEPIHITDHGTGFGKIKNFSDGNMKTIVGSTKKTVFIFVPIIKTFILVSEQNIYSIKHPLRLVFKLMLQNPGDCRYSHWNGSIDLNTYHSNDEKQLIVYCYGPYIITKYPKGHARKHFIQSIHIIKDFENGPQIAEVEISKKVMAKLRFVPDFHSNLDIASNAMTHTILFKSSFFQHLVQQ